MKLGKKFIFIAALCIAAFGLGTCDLWNGSDGQGGIYINLGGNGARLAVPNEEDALEYTVILTGGNITITSEPITGSQTISVPAGIWNLEVRAVGNRPENYAQAGFPARMLRGLGEAEKPVTVKAGETTSALINMTLATQVNTWTQLCTAFVLAGGKREIIEIANDLTANAAATLKDNTAKHITLRGARGGVKIMRNITSEPLFQIDRGTLVLDGVSGGTIEINGNNNTASTRALINVEGGNLVMLNGVTLTNNYSSSTPGVSSGNGGGVYVEGGTFTMEGGTISDNHASSEGGGVCVYDTSGRFIMNGGTISGNIAPRGGNVFIAPGGKFERHGGTISGGIYP